MSVDNARIALRHGENKIGFAYGVAGCEIVLAAQTDAAAGNSEAADRITELEFSTFVRLRSAQTYLRMELAVFQKVQAGRPC